MSLSLSLAKERKPNVPALKTREPRPFAVEEPSGALHPKPSVRVGGDRKILVVEDNPVVLQAFKFKLEASGFAVTTCTSAGGAARVAETSRAQLIILDLDFPTEGAMQWSGFSVIQWLRRLPRLATVPVIMVGGGEPAKYEEQALAAGACAFFQKPMNYPELLAAILQALPGGTG